MGRELDHKYFAQILYALDALIALDGGSSSDGKFPGIQTPKPDPQTPKPDPNKPPNGTSTPEEPPGHSECATLS